MDWPFDGPKGVGATTGDRTRTPGLARRDSTVELPSQGDDAYGMVSRGGSFLTLLVVVGLARIGGGRRRWLAVDPVPQALWLVGDLRPDSSRAGPSSGRTEPNMCAQQRHARVARLPGRSVGEDVRFGCQRSGPRGLNAHGEVRSLVFLPWTIPAQGWARRDSNPRFTA